MTNTTKLILIGLIALSVIAAALAVFAFIGKEREYMKRVMMEDKLAATLKEKRNLEKDMQSNEKAKEEAEKQVKEINDRLEEVKKDLETAKEKSAAAINELKIKKEEIKKLKSALEDERKEKLSISKEYEDLGFEYDKAKSEIVRLKKEKTRLENNLMVLKQKQVDLDKIVVKPEAGGQSFGESEQSRYIPEQEKPMLRGRVLVVNRDYGFVVTDLGKDDGIEKGMKFELRDGTELIARAEVDKVYDTMSSATILSGGSTGRVRKGNLVIESR